MDEVSINAMEFSRKFNWDNTASVTLDALEKANLRKLLENPKSPSAIIICEISFSYLPQILADVLHFAVVGVGWFGSKRISALKKIKDASIEWIVDVDKDRGSEAAKEANANYT